jgi:hypothetical protein
MKKHVDKKTSKSLIWSHFEKFGRRKDGTSKNSPISTSSAATQSESRIYKFWSWILPLLLGIVTGWFGMVSFEIWLDRYERRVRPAFSGVTSSSDQNFESASMIAFLRSNPFKITPKPLPDPVADSDDSGPAPITGSLTAAILRGTLPDIGVLLEDQGIQHVILVNESFDVYTLDEVNYREAVFVRGNERVVKDLLYSKETSPPPSRLRASSVPAVQSDLGRQVIPADPAQGTPGELNRDLIDQLMENPFDELRRVRLRPVADGQGLQIQWINKDSILAQLGVQKDDVIQSINGIVFRNMGDISNSMNSLMNNDRFDVVVMRNGKSTSLQYQVR